MLDEHEACPTKLDFLSLPSEVRLAIYRTFFSGQPRMITYPHIRPISLIDDRHWPLLLASKRVYREAVSEYYGTCLFGLYGLNPAHLQKLLEDLADSHFARHTKALLVWRIPDPTIFEVLKGVRWVKMLGITCGVEPDPANGQIFTYNSLIRAIGKFNVRGFSWTGCQDLFQRHPNVRFMVDVRCDYWETKLDISGNPQRRWIKTNFVYNTKIDTFVEETGGNHKQDGLILRPQQGDTLVNRAKHSSSDMQNGNQLGNANVASR